MGAVLENKSVYEFVIQAVSEGRLFDAKTGEIRSLDTDVQLSPVLQWLRLRNLHKRLCLGLVAGNAREITSSHRSRARKMALILSDEHLVPGKPRKEPTVEADLMFELTHDSVDPRLFSEVEAWQELKPPSEVALQPFARRARQWQGLENDKNQERLLVRYFQDKDHYKELTARYMLGGPFTLTFAGTSKLEALAGALTHAGIPFNVDAIHDTGRDL
ncbi:MAG TPA: hypothetical protein VGN98_01885 [Tianweitania sediminis]|jgi:hypothetical protein|nr:hypothetical protein [Tianweitania sediminis]